MLKHEILFRKPNSWFLSTDSKLTVKEVLDPWPSPLAPLIN